MNVKNGNNRLTGQLLLELSNKSIRFWKKKWINIILKLFIIKKLQAVMD